VGTLLLGESQIETVVDGMIQLTGNSDGAARQASRAEKCFEETRQAHRDFVNLQLADAAEPCRAPCGVADLGDQKIGRYQRRSSHDDGDRLAGVRLLREKPFERDAGVDDQAHRVSRSSRISCSAEG
jgi:hypothetical protein